MNSRSTDSSSVTPQDSTEEKPNDAFESSMLKPRGDFDEQTDVWTTSPFNQPQFGAYEIIEEIARGGMGVVYKARHRELGRIVALKKILAGELACASDVRRFQTEAKAAALLSHPNIVPIFEVGEVDGQHFFTMAYVDGIELSKLASQSLLAPERIATLVYHISMAIDYAHSRGVVHRDLKPSNIIVDGEMMPRVMDFGLAKRLDEQSDLTRSGEVMGTPGYMAPEQAAGMVQDIGPRTDVYGIGAILYSCLTQRPPFVAASPIETLVKILESEPINPRTINKSIPKGLERICLHCMEKEPCKRYSSALAIAQDLDRFLSGQPIASESPSAFNAVRRFSRQYPGFSAHAVAIGFSLGLAQIRFFLEQERNWVVHLSVSALLASWLVFCFLCQYLSVRRSSSRNLVLWESVWLSGDTMFLSGLMYLMTSPTNDPAMLLVGYPMLIVASGLFFRARLVFIVTGMSIITFIVLQLTTNHIARYLHYQFAFVVMLMIIGFSIVHLIRRVRILSAYFESARSPVSDSKQATTQSRNE